MVIKSRWYSHNDKQFIKIEVTRIHGEGVIELSEAPWRAQVLITSENHKKRLVIDYSQMITQLDAYPLHHVDEMVSEIAKYHIYSTLDLQSTYHQIEIKPTDRSHKVFKVNGHLCHF